MVRTPTGGFGKSTRPRRVDWENSTSSPARTWTEAPSNNSPVTSPAFPMTRMLNVEEASAGSKTSKEPVTKRRSKSRTSGKEGIPFSSTGLMNFS